MFTGIITDIGTVAAIERRGDLRVRIACRYDTGTIDLGASIACSGVCLTVVDKGPGWFAVDVSAETLSRTAQGQWIEGLRFNLERALKLGDELGGHIVTGHVDGIGTVEYRQEEGDSLRLTITAGAEIAPYVAPKGSITINGVSLTVNSVIDMPTSSEVEFGVNIIPHTAAMTTLGELHQGEPVNLEIDVLARYLGRMEQLRARKS